MKKWKVYYVDAEGETHKCWTEAPTAAEAIEEVKSEYWNCKEVIYVMPL